MNIYNFLDILSIYLILSSPFVFILSLLFRVSPILFNHMFSSIIFIYNLIYNYKVINKFIFKIWIYSCILNNLQLNKMKNQYFFSVITSGHRHGYSEYQECSSHSDSLSFLRRLIWREIIKGWRTAVPLQSVEPSLVPL